MVHRLLARSIAYRHWQYFLALERSFDTTTRYVEVDKRNFTTYSIEYARLLLAAASEVDVVCKMLCMRIEPETGAGRINQYQPVILGAYPELPTMQVTLPRYGLEFRPWEGWEPNSAPQWWTAYNKVKHERHTEFERANLENVCNALSGLLCLCLLLYYHRGELQDVLFSELPVVFEHEFFPARIVSPPDALLDFLSLPRPRP